MSGSFMEGAADAASRDDNGGRFAHFGRLRHYTVKNLFGFYDHSFALDADEPTILTGANGTGKSTVLRTVNWISRADWARLLRIDFGDIILEFEEARLVVRKVTSENLELRLDRRAVKPKIWQYTASADPVLRHDFSKHFAFLREDFSMEEWEELSPDTRERLLRHLAAERLGDRPGWVSQLADSFPAMLVSDQRLTPERRRRPKKRGTGDTIDVVAAIEAAVLHINEEVKRYKSLYGTASQTLDRNFPRRVFAAISSQRQFGSNQNVMREFQEVHELRASLATTGLIDAAEIEDSIADLPLHNPDSLALISTYLSDTKEKLATFEPLRRRLEPFLDFLRRHYKDKEIRIDEQSGFKIVSIRTGEDISPVHLSSGEQQIFILAHKLLFESSPGTLVMIDEPELSLHVLWQSTFVDDLTEIAMVSGTYFLLATHSPTLIAGRSDLRRPLDG